MPALTPHSLDKLSGTYLPTLTCKSVWRFPEQEYFFYFFSYIQVSMGNSTWCCSERADPKSTLPAPMLTRGQKHAWAKPLRKAIHVTSYANILWVGDILCRLPVTAGDTLCRPLRLEDKWRSST